MDIPYFCDFICFSHADDKISRCCVMVMGDVEIEENRYNG